MKRLFILLAILAPAFVTGQQTVRFKNVKIDSNLILSSMPTDTSTLILVLGADGKVRANRSAGGTGATTDSLAWYTVRDGAFQRNAWDSVVPNSVITFKEGNGTVNAYYPGEKSYNLWIAGPGGSTAWYAEAYGNSGFGGKSKNYLQMSPLSSANVFGFESDYFGNFGYQIDEYGIYPTTYTTLGTYNQHLGIPTNKWKRVYAQRVIADTIPSGALYPPLASSQWTTEADGIYYAGGNVGIGTTNPSATDSTAQVTGSMNVSRGAKFGYDVTVNGLTVGKGGKGKTTNTALGINALKNTINSENVGLGYDALKTSTTASGCVAIGKSAMSASYGGTSNIGIGVMSMSMMNNGSGCVAIGWSSAPNLTSGSYNNGIGHQVLSSLQTGSYNNVLGRFGLYSNTTGSKNIAIGDSAGYFYNLSGRIYIGTADSTWGGIYWDNQNTKHWGRWNGTLMIKSIPVAASQPTYVLAENNNGLVQRYLFPAGTTYTATSPMSVAGNDVHILDDTLTSWRGKMNQGATAYGWGNHSGLYEPIIDPVPIVAGNYYAKHNGSGTTSWETFPAIPAAYDTATNPWRYLSGNTVQRGAGNVGIGTTAPTQALEVGSAAAGGNVLVNATLGTELAPALTGNSGVLWTLSNTTGYVQPFAGTIEKNGDGTGTFTPTAATTIVAGTKYLVQIVLSSMSGGGLFASIGNVTLARITTSGTYNYYVVAENTSKISFLPLDSPTRFVITSISIKAMTAATGAITVPGNVTASEMRNPNGNGYVHISPDGRVGINTRNPATGVLDVSGNIRWGTGAYWTNGNMTYTNITNTYNGVYAIINSNTGTNSAMSFSTKNTEAMRISPSQYIGIGTSAPTELLSLGGNSARKIWMERHTTSNTAGNSLTLQAGGATQGATDKLGGPLYYYPGGSTGNATGIAHQWYTYDAGSTGTADQTATAKMTMLSNGYVGIGTTSPGYKFVVNGDADATTLLANNGAGECVVGTLTRNSGNLNVYSEDDMILSIDKTNNDADTRAFIFYKDKPAVTGTELMRLTETGRLGIGTSAPATKVHIDSTGAAVKIDLKNGVRLEGTATAWDDMMMPFHTGETTGTGYPEFDADSMYYNFVVDTTGVTKCIIYMPVQMPHRWKEGSTIYPHIHYKHTTAEGTPSYKMKYRWVNTGEVPGAWNWYNMTTASGTTANTHQMVYGSGGISASGKTISSMLFCMIYLVDTSTATKTNKAFQFDIHYEIDSFGSNTETSKN